MFAENKERWGRKIIWGKKEEREGEGHEFSVDRRIEGWSICNQERGKGERWLFQCLMMQKKWGKGLKERNG